MNPYMMPMDYTGYGPAQSGFAPTAAQVHQAEMQRFYSSKAAQAMQFQDPWIQHFAAGAARAAGANPNDPLAMRRQMYGTAVGQASLDAATIMRNTGFLGQGNPMAYSYHVNRGITSGGFGVNVMGANGFSGPEQMVYGSGILSDRLAVTGQHALMQSLYGTGTADPSKLYGVNMESAGFISAQVARNRGPAMNAMTVVQNATMGQRIAESIQNTTHDPTTNAVLRGLTGPQMERMQAIAERGNAKEIDEFTKTFDDPKVQAEMRQLVSAKTKSAAFVNENWIKQTKETVKEVAKSLAGLRDVYEGLSDPQLMMQAESLTGIKVTDAASGRRQQRMIDNLKSGALAAGIDANSYFGFIQGGYAGFGNELAGRLGMGPRGASSMRQMEALFMNEAGGNVGVAARMEKEAASRARELGISGVTARDEETIMADIKEGQGRFVSVHGGIAGLAGARSRLMGEQRAAADKILERFANTTDPTSRNALEREARNLLGQGFGGYGQYVKDTATREADFRRVGANADGSGDYVNDAIARLRLADVNVGPLRNVLGSESRAFLQVGGHAALAELEEISKSDQKDKVGQMTTLLMRKGAMSESGAKALIGKLYDASGKSLQSEADRKALYLTAEGLNPNVSATAFGRTAKATSDLLQMDSANNDFRNAVKGDMSLTGILNSMFSGQTGLLDSDQGKIALAQAMKGDGIKLMGKSGTDLTDRVLTGLDVSKGLTPEMVKKINAATGVDLAGASGFKSTDALIAASKDDTGLAKIIGGLKGHAGLSVTGGRNNLSIMSKATMDDLDAAEHTQRAKEYAMAAKFVYGGKETSGLMDSFKAGGKLDIGLAADETTGKGKMANLGKMSSVLQRLHDADSKSVADFMQTEGGRQVLAQFKAERDGVLKQSEAKQKKIETVGEADGKLTKVNTKQTLDAFNSMIDKLESMAAAKTEQTVTYMKVTKMEVDEKK